MEGREVHDIWISKGRPYPPSRVNTMSFLLGFFLAAYLFSLPFVGEELELIAYRYRYLQAFFLIAPPLCFSDQNNWSQELTVFAPFLFNTVETRLPPYHFPASPHLTISHALFPQSLCYGNSGLLLLILISLNKYWYRSVHFPFRANN